MYLTVGTLMAVEVEPLLEMMLEDDRCALYIDKIDETIKQTTGHTRVLNVMSLLHDFVDACLLENLRVLYGIDLELRMCSCCWTARFLDGHTHEHLCHALACLQQ